VAGREPGGGAGRILLVPLGGDDTYDVVRDCVAALALPLCRLEQRRHQVEELFREEVPHA
jgi:ABC-2 type transport system ATP-binding protein